MKVTLEVEVPERECLRCQCRAPCKVQAFKVGWGHQPAVIIEPEGWCRVRINTQDGSLCGPCVMGFAEWLESGRPPPAEATPP